MEKPIGPMLLSDSSSDTVLPFAPVPWNKRLIYCCAQCPDGDSPAQQEEALPAEKERIYEQVWEEAKANGHLFMVVDDFAIKKGHTYNIGPQIVQLAAGEHIWHRFATQIVNASQHPDFRQVAPYAVVMDDDLAPADRPTSAEGGCPPLRGSGQMISISFCPFG